MNDDIQVKAVVSDSEYTLTYDRGKNEYSTKIDAPVIRDSIIVPITITASNEIIESVPIRRALYVTGTDDIFITPKTDWKPTDRINMEDYNRIKNNLKLLGKIGNEIFSDFRLTEMGADKTDYKGYWKPSEFNVLEENLEIIIRNYPPYDAGEKKTFFYNAPFIDYKELNRIESAILYFYTIASKHRATLPKLAFRLGNMRGVRT